MRLVGIVVCCFLLASCQQVAQADMPKNFIEREQVVFEQMTSSKTNATVGIIGDILLHKPLYTYDNYDFAFQAVAQQLQSIDFLVANQESMPGGVELQLSGYPSFNSPKHIIRDLKNNGIDMVSLANNHTIDRGERGLRNVFKHLEEYDMPYVGAYASEEDKLQQRIVERNGIQIGILAYTYGTNGIPVPAGKEYLVTLIEAKMIEEQLRELKKNVDVAILSIHWGDEYALHPNSEQIELAKMAVDAGADIVFGHHPHVLQPYEQIEKSHVFYSVGNFYSAQQFDTTNIGGIARVELEKITIAGKHFIQVQNPKFYPTAVILDEQKRYTVVPLHQAPSLAVQKNEAWVEAHVGLPKW